MSDRHPPDLERPGRLWVAGRVLIGLGAVALVVAGWFAFRPLDNPGVQRCGAPVAFALTGEDRRIRALDPDVTPELLALADSPSCRDRTGDALRVGLVAFGAGVALGLAGAMLGLVDDRLALRRAPRFESLLKERPVDAPGLVWDRPVVPVDDLGVRLPEAESPTMSALFVLGAVALGALTVVGGPDDVLASLASVAPVAVLALVALVPIGWAARAAQLTATDDRSSGFARVLPTAVAGSFVGPALADLGAAGLGAHQGVLDGETRESAVRTAAATAAMGAAVHAAVLVVVASIVVATGTGPAPLPVGAGWVALAAAVLVIAGLATGVLRIRRQVVPQGRDSLRTLESWLADRPRLLRLVASALVIALLPAVAAVLAVTVVGADTRLLPVALAGLLVPVAVLVAPTPAGVGLVEALLAVGFWRAGASAAEGAAAVLVVRAATLWLPMVPGYVAYRRLRAACPPDGTGGGPALSGAATAARSPAGIAARPPREGAPRSSRA